MVTSEKSINNRHTQKTNVIQVNKQSTIVNVGKTCKPKKKAPVRRAPASEKICGKIFQTCSTDPKLYFRSVDARPSAIVQVENNSDCVMRAIITLGDERTFTESIKQEQQLSMDVPCLKNLSIACSGEDNRYCKGYYTIWLRPILSRHRRKKRAAKK